MKPERWQQLSELFHAALERAPEERGAFLDEACAGDESLHKQVEDFIAGHEAAGSFIESPAIEVAARGVAADRENPEAELASGETVSHYRIISPIGVGGMGEVFLAHDMTLGRQVALKLLPAEFTSNPDRVRRFQQEARAASSLNHPNIITIHQIGQAEDRHFIATEFIDGLTLREYLRGGPGSRDHLSESLSITMQVADALAAAHAKGIVHRDIKPENIMVVRDSHLMQKGSLVKVLDFGIAKLTEIQTTGSEDDATTRVLLNTHEGSVIGTASYMSPEQARGEQVDARTDVWSLGVVLYEMLTNAVPFVGNTTQDVIASILKEEAPPISIDVPDRLRWIVEKALRKHREERYQTIREMFSDLRDLQRQEGARSGRGGPSLLTGPGTAGISAESTSEVEGALTSNPAWPTRLSAENISGAVGRHKRATALLLMTLLLAIAAAAYLFYFAKSGKAAIDSVAVLPFTTGDDPTMEYLSDGLSASLTNSLSQLPQLKVCAQSSTFKYKGKDFDVQEVGNALGVEAIVTGKIVRLGDDLQINVELVSARHKTQMWGQQFNRKATDLLGMQEEIVRSIVANLRVTLTGGQEQQLTKRPTQNTEAYERYMNGEFYTRKTGIANYRKALEYYEQAIALDPNFALAYAGLAETYSYLAGSPGFDPKESNAKAKAAAEKALELDKTVARAHVWLGITKTGEWDWPGAESEFKRALELNPNYSSVHGLYPFYLSAMGRHTEALAEAKLAQELDPLQVRPKFSEAVALYFARRYDEAIKQLQHVLDLQPGFSGAHDFLGDSYAMKGMYPESIAEYRKENSNEGDTGGPFLGYAYAMSGNRDEALAILKQLKATKEYVSPTGLAVLYAGLGDKEAAFQSLERAYAAHDILMQYLKVDPHFDSLRSDPRFTDLMRRVGLPL